MLIAGTALWQLRQDVVGIAIRTDVVGETPITIYRTADADPAPLVLIAHGFAGSQRLMEPIALAVAGAGYVAVTYDFLGHGRHPDPMRGELGEQDGTPVYLIEQTREVVDATLQLPGVDGRLAILGHSMATNILVQYAQEDDRVGATVGISMYAPTIEAESPGNLLAIVGALERQLIEEGRGIVAMAADLSPDAVVPGTTYGSFSGETARRLAIAPRVEHVSVLYSATTLDESVAWLNAVFERGNPPPRAARHTGQSHGRGHGRGLWIAALLGAVFLLARSLTSVLPRVTDEPGGGNASWRRLAVVAGIPTLLTPLILRILPTGFLPVIVADYLAVHFCTFGVLSAALLWWTAGRPGGRQILRATDLADGGGARIALGAGLLVVWFLTAVSWPIDSFFTAFYPIAERLPLMLAVLVGTLPYFVTDEWLTRGPDARRGAYPVTKVLFLLSLALAVALDFEALFFLIIIIPVTVIFFTVQGLVSRWVFASTGSPLVAGLSNAVAFAWAMGVTFPLYAGP